MRASRGRRPSERRLARTMKIHFLAGLPAMGMAWIRRAPGSCILVAIVLHLAHPAAGIGQQPSTAPPPPGLGDGNVILELVSGDGQSWYLGRQLREPLVFRITGQGMGSAECRDLRVYFSSEDAERLSPLVGDPTWEDGDCLVRTWWTLGFGIGRQHLRAEVPGHSRRASAHAVARQGARIFFGGAWTPRQDGWSEVHSGDGGPSLRGVEPTGGFHPILGVDFPLWPSLDRLRMAAAAGSPHLDRYFFFGFSGLQAFLFGPAQEGSPVDLHLGFQLSRREVGQRGDRCAPELVCSRRDLRFGGFSALVTIDGASTFRGLAGAVLR